MTRTLISLLFLLITNVVRAQSLSGTVSVVGAENNALATIRITDLNIGTTAKLDGTYHIDGIKPGKHNVEYSFIGHKTVRETVVWNDGEDKVLNVKMVEEPIMLDALFVTPDGSDAARYILNKVWANAEKKQRKLSSFNANASTVLSFSGFDIVSEFMPATMRKVILFSASLVGMKTLVRMILDNPNLHVRATSKLNHTRGKYTWKDAKITECNISATEKEKAMLSEIVDNGNLYDIVYGSDNLLRSKKVKAKLKGSYEDRGKFVYVIEGKKGSRQCTMHVVEDSWDVLRMEYKDEMERTIVECRKAVDGLYLPVSINRRLTFYDKSAKEVMKEIEENAAERTEKQQKKVEKKAQKFKEKLDNDEAKKERVDVIRERIKEHGIHIVVNYGTTINFK